MLKVLVVVGARPNFMKAAPLVKAMARRPEQFAARLVHTGQHYDPSMSDAFFRDLGMPQPAIHLGVGSGTHSAQTAAVMTRFEPVVMEDRPDWVIVVGDVNSTLACALVCAKIGVRTAHVEAGLRSRDRSMPEEINRILTDQIADLLLTPTEEASAHLRAEGIPEARIRFVGNIMIDSLRSGLAAAERSDVRSRLQVDGVPYAVLTLHRPSNVDDPSTLRRLMGALEAIAERIALVFPVHPRTVAALDALPRTRSESDRPSRILRVEPLGYLDFLRLSSGARLVLTDSGGIQEETTALGIPCITLRENTERPITLTMGTNVLAGTDPDRILRAAFAVLDGAGDRAKRPPPPLWDGHTADRILDAMAAASPHH